MTQAECLLMPEEWVRRQVLPAYWFGDWHWAAAHVLCLVGAVLGSIASFAWQAHENSTTEGGAPTWLVRLLPWSHGPFLT